MCFLKWLAIFQSSFLCCRWIALVMRLSFMFVYIWVYWQCRWEFANTAPCAWAVCACSWVLLSYVFIFYLVILYNLINYSLTWACRVRYLIIKWNIDLSANLNISNFKVCTFSWAIFIKRTLYLNIHSIFYLF